MWRLKGIVGRLSISEELFRRILLQMVINHAIAARGCAGYDAGFLEL